MLPTFARRLVSWGIVLGCAGVGCTGPGWEAPPADEASPDAPREAPVRPSSGEPPEAPPGPSTWPPEVEDLQAGLAAFVSVEDCLARLRTRAPVEVAEGLSDLGYDAFFEDVCRSFGAVRDRAPDRCDELTVSTARRGCRRRYALLEGAPDACPEDLAIDGREPLCLAWASRDAGLCRAVARAERGACEAVLGQDPARCRGPDRARCEAWVRRYGGAVRGASRAGTGTREEPFLRLEVSRVDPSGVEAAPRSVDLETIARGVLLSADGCRHRVVLDDRGPHGAQLPFGREGARIAFSLPEGGGSDRVRLEGGLGSVELTLPELGRIGGGEGRITVTASEPVLGGRLEGTIEARLPTAPGAVLVRGTFRTFVRDVEPLPATCAGVRMPTP